MLKILPCLDSNELAESRRSELDIPRHVAAERGRTAVEAAERGSYESETGEIVDWSHLVAAACAAKVSIPSGDLLPTPKAIPVDETRIQVSNETTLGAAARLIADGFNVVALNFANGVTPGGGFLNGAKAQEEAICRSSALYHTLVGDAMYASHRERPRADSTDWAIHSPRVPIFRSDEGRALTSPWQLNFITCAAPYAPTVGAAESAALLEHRIRRVLAIAQAFGYSALVLGAWGCGAFGNDPNRTARDFRRALEVEFQGVFAEVVFAISDWSPERRFLSPFRRVFGPADSAVD